MFQAMSRFLCWAWILKKKKVVFVVTVTMVIRGWTGSSTFDWPDFGETGAHSSGIYLLIDEVLCKSLGPE